MNNIAKTLDNCIENPQILRQKAEGVIQCRKKYLWSDRIATINSLYDKAIDDFNTLN